MGLPKYNFKAETGGMEWDKKYFRKKKLPKHIVNATVP